VPLTEEESWLGVIGQPVSVRLCDLIGDEWDGMQGLAAAVVAPT